MLTGGKPRVLIVDDQAALRRLLADVLAREGFEPIQASDGVQAAELFRTQAPLVVVSDVVMPRMDGLALLNEVKRIDRGAVVILMTGQGNEEILLRALRGGASNFFRKPFNVRELLQEIHKVVDFRLEAARSTLFSPYLVSERKSFIVPRADSPFHAIVNQIALQLPCIMPPEEIVNLRIGIEEMVANAVEHGNLGITYEEKDRALAEGTLADLLADRGRASDAAGRTVRITSSLSRELFEVSIADDGPGFDWRALPAVAPRTILSFDGRGIFLTKIYYDEVLYNDRGTEVTLRKRARAP